jgi:hypothetical protein
MTQTTEEIKDYARKWREKNRDHVNKKAREYYEKNKVELQAARKLRRSLHSAEQKIKDKTAQHNYYEKNKEHLKQLNAAARKTPHGKMSSIRASSEYRANPKNKERIRALLAASSARRFFRREGLQEIPQQLLEVKMTHNKLKQELRNEKHKRTS